MEVTININAPAIAEALNNLSETVKLLPEIAKERMAAYHEAEARLTELQSVTAPTVQLTETTPQDAPTANAQPLQQAMANVIPPAANTPQMTAQSALPPVQQATPPIIDEAYRNRVCTAAARLVEQGKMPDVLALLQSFGVPAVTQLSATQLPEFAAQIAALGAVI